MLGMRVTPTPQGGVLAHHGGGQQLVGRPYSLEKSAVHVTAAEATLVQKVTIERGSLGASRASSIVKCLGSESEFRFLR